MSRCACGSGKTREACNHNTQRGSQRLLRQSGTYRGGKKLTPPKKKRR